MGDLKILLVPVYVT